MLWVLKICLLGTDRIPHMLILISLDILHWHVTMWYQVIHLYLNCLQVEKEATQLLTHSSSPWRDVVEWNKLTILKKKTPNMQGEKNDPGDFTFLWQSLCFLLRCVLVVCVNKYLGANCRCFISKENQGCILTSCLSWLIRCQTWLKSSGICFKS